MNILALEESTSSAKALLYSTEKGVIDVISQPYSSENFDGYTQDADGIFKQLISSASALLKQWGGDIDAISLSSIWPCLLLLDENKKPLGRIITWADTECSHTVKKYSHLSEAFYKRTGCTVHSIYGLWKYIHLKEHSPEIIKRTKTVTSQGGYLAYRLTGKNICSCSSASANGFLNIHNLDWDDKTLEFAGISRDMLPELCEAGASFTLRDSAAKLLGLPAGIPVIIGGGDGALNQLGSSATEEGIMTFSMGTSAAIRLAYMSAATEDSSLWCYYLTENIRLVGAATSGAGNCVNWFKEKLFSNTFSFTELEKMLENADRANAPIFLPFLFGERCPGWNSERKGGFSHISAQCGPSELYYSVLEGILFNVYQCYEKLIAQTGKPKRIILSGGITNSPQWLQMAADIFSVPMEISNEEHASVMGAVVLAMKSLGIIKDFSEYKTPIVKKIMPDASSKKHYKDRYKKYLAEYYNEVAND